MRSKHYHTQQTAETSQISPPRLLLNEPLKTHFSSFIYNDSPFFSPSVSTDLVFSWIFNEYPTFVKQDTRRFISQETGNLYIAKVEPSDVGNYTCVVTNTVTKTRVQGPPTPLVLRNDGEH